MYDVVTICQCDAAGIRFELETITMWRSTYDAATEYLTHTEVDFKKRTAVATLHSGCGQGRKSGWVNCQDRWRRPRKEARFFVVAML